MNKVAVSYFASGALAGILIASAGFALFLRGGGSGPAAGRPDVLTLKLGHTLDPSHPVHTGMVFMKERLEELSGGRVTMDIYPSGVLGSETEMIEQLQNGALAMLKTSTAPMEGFIPEMAVFSLPYVFDDADHYWRVLDSGLGKELLLSGESKFLRGLCYYDSGSRNFYTKGRPILTPDDMKGMKIRVMNSRTAMDMISTLGGAPTPIAWGELYTALQQGTVDGAENNPPSFQSSRHYEVCKHFSLDAHSMIPDILLVSTEVWKGLDPQVRSWLQQAADESSLFQRDLWKKETQKALEAVQAEGVTIYHPDKTPFIDRVQPMLATYKGTMIGDLVERIRAMRESQ